MRRGVWLHHGGILISQQMHDSWKEKIDGFILTQADSYVDREKERNDKRPQQNDRIGKYGEEYARHYLSCVYEISGAEVDYEARQMEQKGWVPDLILPDGTHFHVKTCQLSTRKLSWTFSWKYKTREGGRDRLFRNMDSTEIIVLMFVPTVCSLKAEFVATTPWRIVSEKVQETEPDTPAYKEFKRVLNYSDLVNLAPPEDRR